jgi:hypothetical protein
MINKVKGGGRSPPTLTSLGYYFHHDEMGVRQKAAVATLCVLGGFNVSNLMGIKRRMIDIGKKITFYFLQNV